MKSMLPEDHCLVPRAIVTRAEIFPGFGVPEIAAVVAGGAIGAVLQLLPGLFGLPVVATLFLRFFLFALCAGGAYFLVRPGMGGDSSSLLDLLRDHLDWKKSVKTYYHERRGPF